MRGVILGDRNARGRRVMLPGGALKELAKDVIKTCIVPTAGDSVCGAKFYKGQEKLAEQHALTCTKENEHHIRALFQRVSPDIMKPWDPEYADWCSQNFDAIMRGRMKA